MSDAEREAKYLMRALVPLDAAAEARGLRLDPAWVLARLPMGERLSHGGQAPVLGLRCLSPGLKVPVPALGRWLSAFAPFSGALAAAVLVFGIRVHTPLTAENAEIAEEASLARPFGTGAMVAPVPAVKSRPVAAQVIHPPSPLEAEGDKVLAEVPTPLTPVGSDRPVAHALPLSGGGLGESSKSNLSYSTSHSDNPTPLPKSSPVLSLRVLNSLLDQAGEIARIEVRAAGHVVVTVYDRRGRKVLSLFEGEVRTTREIRWDGRDSHGGAVPSGIYLIVAEAGEARSTGKVTVTK